MDKIVYVVGGDSSVESMFERRGWRAVTEKDLAYLDALPDLVCFTGGPDINPKIYGQENTASHGIDDRRDAFELEVYDDYQDFPKVGICRGGQLLNVLAGGSMIQHIDGHSYGDHKIWYLTDRMDDIEYMNTREDHHQAMVKHYSGQTLGRDVRSGDHGEIIYYRDKNSLCFQAHPEWNHQGTEELFFKLIEEYLEV